MSKLVTLPSQGASSDSGHAFTRCAYLRVLYNGTKQASIKLDAYNGGVIKVEIVDADDNPVAGEASVNIDLAHLTGTNKAAQFRQLNWKDADTCIEYKAWVLMTEQETA